MTMIDSPTTVLPVVTPKHRKRWGRKRTVLTLVAMLVGLPALALAATYLWGVLHGQTVVTTSTADVSVVTASGSDYAPNGGSVSCVLTKPTSGTTTDVDIVAKTASLSINGAPGVVSPGQCTVTITVHNGSTVDASVNAAAAQLPTGWTFTPPATSVLVPKGANADVVITIAASPAAQEGFFTGQLKIDIPPAGGASS